ncbi:MAG: hypothetical protein QOJ81_1534 [Chloroflexota bacterium]|jgi:hypothetical protein|nr:hypothetical protein [Chloroflexota bacterium]
MTAQVIHKFVVGPLIAAILALGLLATGPVQIASAFTGHGCTKATCSFFTSSYAGTTYYYKRSTCGQWRSLSNTYLQGFKTSTALLASYPGRKLHKPC